MPEIEEYSPENNLFHKYELGKLLGCGAFAKVYHARNIITGQSVAVKVISKQKILKGGLTAHIKREISIMRRLHHPNIVKLYEVLATKTKIYFVIEFVKGGELFGKLSKASRFSEDTSRRYFQQLISAIHYCHSHGVYHRDLKPENLLIDENGDLKVSDFGLSAVTEQVRQDGLLHTLCGTPAYVAPEILTKQGYDGAKIDIWSCGIILYVLNAGYLPFNDPNLMLMYRKIYKGEFRCPKWFSPDLRRFLSRLLDTNPQTRITVDEILHDPWFVKGYEDVRIEDETNYGAFFGPKTEEEDRKETFLTAFDLISFSSGFDLSNLFADSYNLEESERFITSELPDDIIDRIEGVANEENLRVTKKVWTLTLIGQDGNFVAVVEIYRLTESMFVVDVRSSSPVWKKLILPKVFGSDYETK